MGWTRVFRSRSNDAAHKGGGGEAHSGPSGTANKPINGANHLLDSRACFFPSRSPIPITAPSSQRNESVSSFFTRIANSSSSMLYRPPPPLFWYECFLSGVRQIFLLFAGEDGKDFFTIFLPLRTKKRSGAKIVYGENLVVFKVDGDGGPRTEANKTVLCALARFQLGYVIYSRRETKSSCRAIEKVSPITLLRRAKKEKKKNQIDSLNGTTLILTLAVYLGAVSILQHF